MGRIRTVKPDFWKHEELSELPEASHMLAAALLNYADDEGYFRAHPGLIKGECCPLREPSVSLPVSLQQLAEIGYIKLGVGSDGKQYGLIVKFKAHQRVSHPTDSKIKDLEIVWEDSRKPHGTLTEASALKGIEGNRREEEKKDAVSDETGGEPPRVNGLAASEPESLEAEVYRFGKQVLGQGAGGMITKLRQHCHNDLLEVRDLLRLAKSKGDPREYVAAILKPEEDPHEAMFRGAL